MVKEDAFAAWCAEARALLRLTRSAVAEAPPTAGPGQEPADGDKSVDPAAAFNARLAAVVPLIKEAVATAAPSADEAKRKAGEAGALARSKDFEGAHRLLDEAMQALAAGRAVVTLKAQWERRLAVLEPQVLEAQKANRGDARLMAMLMAAQDLAAEGEFQAGLDVLDRLEMALDAPLEPPDVSLLPMLDAWAAVRAEAVKTLRAEIADLAAAAKRAAASSQQADGSFDILAAEAELELRAVIQALNRPVETPAQAAQMKNFVEEDDVVADVCEVGGDFRPALVDALDSIVAGPRA